jgi:two-component sensor histidine kinase
VALIHEKLQEFPGLSKFRLKSYLSDIIQTIFGTLTDEHVSVEPAIDDVELETKRAVALGLIVSELATNTSKHGMADGGSTIFRPALTEDTEARKYVPTVGNSGKPFPADVSLDNPGSLRMRLISTLVDQLDGSIELARRPTPTFRLVFALSPRD